MNTSLRLFYAPRQGFLFPEEHLTIIPPCLFAEASGSGVEAGL